MSRFLREVWFQLLCPAGLMEVDILEFKVPVENHKTLFVWDIQPEVPEDKVHAALLDWFGSFGPLHLLKVFPNAAPHPRGFYALLRFYSGVQAAAAQRQADGRPLFQTSPLKVRLSSKRTHYLSACSRPLSHAHCLELANHCLGFNGWTSDIITLKELTNEEENEEEEEEEEQEEEEEEEEEGGRGGGRRRRLKFGCLLQLSFPQHGKTTRAAAVVEDRFTCTGPDDLLQNRSRLQKRVREKALVQAFSSVLLVLLGSGRVMVELRQTSDQFLPESTAGELQVQEVPWRELAADEEAADEEWDLTVS